MCPVANLDSFLNIPVMFRILHFELKILEIVFHGSLLYSYLTTYSETTDQTSSNLHPIDGSGRAMLLHLINHYILINSYR